MMATKKKSPKLEMVRAEIKTLAPRFATSISCTAREDHFILDFWYGLPPEEPRIHLGRYAITPSHAKRLNNLLGRQLRDREVVGVGRLTKKTTRKKLVRKTRKKSGKKRRKKV